MSKVETLFQLTILPLQHYTKYIILIFYRFITKIQLFLIFSSHRSVILLTTGSKCRHANMLLRKRKVQFQHFNHRTYTSNPHFSLIYNANHCTYSMKTTFLNKKNESFIKHQFTVGTRQRPQVNKASACLVKAATYRPQKHCQWENPIISCYDTKPFFFYNQ